MTLKTIFSVALLSILIACNDSNKVKKSDYLTLEEQEVIENNDSINTIITSTNLTTTSNKVILTGLDSIRLVSMYKIKPESDKNINYYEDSSYYRYHDKSEDSYNYFMPGLDIINGYNLINIAHYNLGNEKTSFLFKKPVLIKTVYYPGVKKDSLLKKPIQRDYFMVSVYDEDTNNDTLINKKDLRKLYHFDKFNTKKTQLLPSDYGVIKSTYDYKNDIMYIYAKHDSNKNGTGDKNEAMHIFWIDLNDPKEAKKML
ncbi:hypothetical protein [Flavobacterium sp.]|uniref:hypothetical protein n=1 Tax=Flavobacterium sp. TaxID=239 RepID=UPI0040476139